MRSDIGESVPGNKLLQHCVTTRTTAKELGWKASSAEWWQTQALHHELFISPEVVRELSAPDFPASNQALAMLKDVSVLELSPPVVWLAELLVTEKVMPGPSFAGDALHVACAAYAKMDYLLTWNVKHLANPNKRLHLGILLARFGLSAPLLVTPDILQVSDD